MCFFCGCGGGGPFQSVQVILPSEIKALPDDQKDPSILKKTGKRTEVS